MARAHIPMNISEEGAERQAFEGEGDNSGLLVKYYKATELIPDPKHHLHRLLSKQPAAWASVQITCGIVSLGLGVVFAASFKIEDYFLTLFRVPIMTGITFLFVGLLSQLLYKYPGLLQMCFVSNVGVSVMGVIGAVLLSVDLASVEDSLQYKVEILLLCVTVLDLFISTILIVALCEQVFTNAEKRIQEKKYSSS